jgi:hypothetical protein
MAVGKPRYRKIQCSDMDVGTIDRAAHQISIIPCDTNTSRHGEDVLEANQPARRPIDIYHHRCRHYRYGSLVVYGQIAEAMDDEITP